MTDIDKLVADKVNYAPTTRVCRVSWTPLQDRRLREFYEQYRGEKIPIDDIAVILDKNPNTVKGRALKLGLTEHNRLRGSADKVEELPCPICGTMFRAIARGAGRRVRACSMSCAQKLWIKENGHPKRMAGKNHSEETKARLGEISRERWIGATPEQREAAADRARQMTVDREPSEQTHSRGRAGRRADLDDRFFRSSWEANYARWLNYRRDVIGDITGWEYEPQRFDFPIKRGTNSYLPDFKVAFPDGRVEWHEVKGWMTQQGATAIKRFKQFFPEEIHVLVDAPVYKSIAAQARSLIEAWE